MMSNIIFKIAFLRNTILHKNKLAIYPFLHLQRNSATDSKNTEPKSNNLIRHNFHVDCEDGLNHQINQEFCVSYVYLYMVSFDSILLS